MLSKIICDRDLGSMRYIMRMSLFFRHGMQINCFLLIEARLARTTSSTLMVEFGLAGYHHLLAKLVAVKPGQSVCT